MNYEKETKKHWLLELEEAYKRLRLNTKLGNWVMAALDNDYIAMLEERIRKYEDGDSLINEIKYKVYLEPLNDEWK